ncbi:MAG: helix-turn-helix transcriptional regulator [Roseburia sp.]|nr:helix-turn-helix transcriptional regulator [Roseburia sp.]
MSKSIGNILKSIREKAMYTTEKLADFLGVDETVIADWEAGKSEPTVTQGMMLGNLYGMPMEELFGEVDVYDAVPEDVQGEFEHHAWLNRVANYS